jgi:CBS-domain-containing membrane protein
METQDAQDRPFPKERDTMKTEVKDVMTTRVIWVKRDATFREMAVALRENRVSAFPVIDDDGTVVGVVSEADLLTKEALADQGLLDGLLHHRDQNKARGITAGDLMTTAVVAVRPQDTVEHAAKLMYERRVKRLPVTDANGHLVGIVSRADVLAVFGRSDEDIRQEIADEVIPGEFLMHPETVAATVHDGVVTLLGVPETNAAGHQIVQVIRHVEGVVAVRDRFSYLGTDDDRFDVLANSPAD